MRENAGLMNVQGLPLLITIQTLLMEETLNTASFFRLLSVSTKTVLTIMALSMSAAKNAQLKKALKIGSSVLTAPLNRLERSHHVLNVMMDGP